MSKYLRRFEAIIPEMLKALEIATVDASAFDMLDPDMMRGALLFRSGPLRNDLGCRFRRAIRNRIRWHRAMMGAEYREIMGFSVAPNDDPVAWRGKRYEGMSAPVLRFVQNGTALDQQKRFYHGEVSKFMDERMHDPCFMPARKPQPVWLRSKPLGLAWPSG